VHLQKPLLILLFALCATIACAAPSSTTPSVSTLRYTFSWQLDGTNLIPRGGTTRGPAVTLDRTESAAWKTLREGGLSDFERDRRAILAMAGTYRVTFDFLEVVQFDPQAKPTAPYQSWGTEKVYVDADQGKFISLVHILEMRVIQDDGKVSEPMVTKHWRQDWRYEPREIVEYEGNDRWGRRRLDAPQNRRAWSQTVYQVDESPRYASIGRWEHSASFSSWLSGDTWRPLPRREWSVRDDYQVLLGTNRHTINPSGWVQEENNLKTVLNDRREIDAVRPHVAREYGVARYERIRDADFAEADQYFEHTRKFWDEVRDAWAAAFQKHTEIALRGSVDKLGLFKPLFAQADAIMEQDAASDRDAKVIRAALTDMGVPD
jgi:hypothetical protein